MDALQRHHLAWLGSDTWPRLLEPRTVAPWDAQAIDCLRHWASHDLPLVVTRQALTWSGQRADEPLRLGIAAPARWGRRRLFVEVRADDVRRTGRFPAASEIGDALPPAAREGWQALCAGLARLGVDARVYGSHGWQQLSDMATVHDLSDIDLLLPVSSAPQADSAVALLQRAGFDAPRLDGEIVFADGGAVAWREWAVLRAGKVRQVLVKRLRGAELEDGSRWRAPA